MKATKENLKKIIFVLILIAVILTAVILYFSKAKYNELYFDYNGFEVRRTNTGYRMKIFINENKDANYINIRTDPRELESIYIEKGIKDLILNKEEIYVVIDPYENLSSVATMAALEIDSKLDNPFLFDIPVKSAFVKKQGETIVKTCKDVNETSGVIWLRLRNETRVYEENKCIFLEGSTEFELVKAADKLVLVLLGLSN